MRATFCLVLAAVLCATVARGSTTIKSAFNGQVLDSNWYDHPQDSSTYHRPNFYDINNSPFQEWDLIWQGGNTYAIRQSNDLQLCLELNLYYSDAYPQQPYLAPCDGSVEQKWDFVIAEPQNPQFSMWIIQPTQFNGQWVLYALDHYDATYSNPYVVQPPWDNSVNIIGMTYYWWVTLPDHGFNCHLFPSIDLTEFSVSGYPFSQTLAFSLSSGETIDIPLKGINSNLLNTGAVLTIELYSPNEHTAVVYHNGSPVYSDLYVYGSATSATPAACYGGTVDVTKQFWDYPNPSLYNSSVPSSGKGLIYNFCDSVHRTNNPFSADGNNLFLYIKHPELYTIDLVLKVSVYRGCTFWYTDGTLHNGLQIGASPNVGSSFVRSPNGRYAMELTPNGVVQVLEIGNPLLPIIWSNYPGNVNIPVSGVYALQFLITGIRIRNLDTGAYTNLFLSGIEQPSTLVMQDDGNLVSYRSDGHPIWATGTDQGSSIYPHRLWCPGHVIHGPGSAQISYTCTSGSCVQTLVYEGGNIVTSEYTVPSDFYCYILSAIPFGQVSTSAVVTQPTQWNTCSTGGCCKYGYMWDEDCIGYYTDSCASIPLSYPCGL
eukprot:Phypoly_transcript_04759.p1 GENE.Phypoly_transcript_04759~~Phypoly_transcript_04759.p1  ORF type:complete len:599 (-),score=51.20 Phypoly_transcript_04759:14-1810(-)